MPSYRFRARAVLLFCAVVLCALIQVKYWTTSTTRIASRSLKQSCNLLPSLAFYPWKLSLRITPSFGFLYNETLGCRQEESITSSMWEIMLACPLLADCIHAGYPTLASGPF